MNILSIPQKVNSNVVRLVGGQVFLLSIVYILLRQAVIPAFLLLDFMIRAAGRPRFSILAQVAVLLAKIFGLKEKPIFFSPKRFAAGIGVVLTASTLIAFMAGAVSLSLGIISILGIFSFLEGVFGFCAGCKIYGFLMMKNIIPDRFCEVCAH
ncbi:DUF4395 domain-containing protein [Oceanispirochaeta crateris]|uniref:DUF4395 domain-containing protein n=1 Tax=Oceanispirochaeta crateris TaxID=2518645 RepID=A0A5C1QHB4_9SPIO|nr:DUF4395 domain-containing protein [Oceanispirochaeta crateris]QEN06479.1 DUF4395 domain-containing protein [Oceanispirochaeta crateris]